MRVAALALFCMLVNACYAADVHSRGETFRGPPIPILGPQPNYQRPPQNYQQSQSFVSSQVYNTQYQPQSAPYNNRAPTQQQPQRYPQPQLQGNLDSRFQGDDASTYRGPTQNDALTTRRPGKVTSGAALAPPTAIPTRFDDINSRKIPWDPEMAKKTEEFSLTLFAILQYLEDENIMISPYSIHTLLVMIADGAGGNTYRELNTTLGLFNPMRTRDYHQYINIALNKSDSDVTLQKFAALIGDENRPVQREYEDIVEKIYDADYIPVKFNDVDKTLRLINSEVARKTNGQIREALTRDELFRAQLILLSGVHFKGNWKHVFNSTFTKRAPFYDEQNQRILGEANMMFQLGTFAYTAVQDIGAYILELPYGARQQTTNRNDDPTGYNLDRIVMIVVLPKKGQPLFETINNINKFGMERIFKELKKAKEEYEDEEIEVHLPKFETETSINLVEALQNMGIKDLFDQSTADLSKINQNYFVSSILHKTKIRVDEKGTEASAVSTSIFVNKQTPPVFNANRPFLYFIADKATRSILFAGAYKKPSVL